MGHSCFSKIPNGCNGLEDRLSVIWDKGVNTGKLTMSDFVRVTSANSAKIFNMYPRKGVIQEGSDADIIIFDPKATKTISRHTHHQVVDFNVFEGMKVTGVPQTCLLSGKEVFHEGKLNVTPGTGKYISRDVHGYSYERIPYLDKMKAIRETPVNRDKKD
jgi:dihydropyrimidinase